MYGLGSVVEIHRFPGVKGRDCRENEGPEGSFKTG